MKGKPVVHFEIGCRKNAETVNFYASVFGWKPEQRQHNTGIDTDANKGISGFVTSLGHEPHNYINLYIEVEDIPAMLEKIEAKGGKAHIGPLPTGTGQEFAWFKDPEGTMMALITPKKSEA